MSTKDPARETSRASLAESRGGGIFAFRVERVASMCAHVRCSIESTARADKKQLHKQTIAFSFTFDAMNAAHTVQIPPRRSGSARLTRRHFSRSRFCASSTSRASPPRAALSRRYPPRRASDQLRTGPRNAATRPFAVGGAKAPPPPRRPAASPPPLSRPRRRSLGPRRRAPSPPTRRRLGRLDGAGTFDGTASTTRPRCASVDPGTGTRRVAAPIRVPPSPRRRDRGRVSSPRSNADARDQPLAPPKAESLPHRHAAALIPRGFLPRPPPRRSHSRPRRRRARGLPPPPPPPSARARARRRPRARLPPALPTRPPR